MTIGAPPLIIHLSERYLHPPPAAPTHTRTDTLQTQTHLKHTHVFLFRRHTHTTHTHATKNGLLLLTDGRCSVKYFAVRSASHCSDSACFFLFFCFGHEGATRSHSRFLSLCHFVKTIRTTQTCFVEETKSFSQLAS